VPSAGLRLLIVDDSFTDEFLIRDHLKVESSSPLFCCVRECHVTVNGRTGSVGRPHSKEGGGRKKADPFILGGAARRRTNFETETSLIIWNMLAR
jgi:hypothetical protein